MSKHVPVLLNESIDGLEPALKAGIQLDSPGQADARRVYLDGTFGGGGHSGEVLKRFGNTVGIIALDQDPRVGPNSEFLIPNFEFRRESFRNLDKVLMELGVSKVDAILLDLGISSDQLESSRKGFTFQNDEPLDMRMGDEGITAADVLNEFDEKTLELIIRGFGEERYSRQIAREIVSRREVKPFETTFDLSQAVENAVPTAYKRGRINPATRTFQAIRIAVNEELTALEEGLSKGWQFLSSEGGRMAVISFHSLEDRIVKNFFRNKAKTSEGKLIVKKPITPSEEEINRNPRSRSAKLRIIEKI